MLCFVRHIIHVLCHKWSRNITTTFKIYYRNHLYEYGVEQIFICQCYMVTKWSLSTKAITYMRTMTLELIKASAVHTSTSSYKSSCADPRLWKWPLTKQTIYLIKSFLKFIINTNINLLKLLLEKYTQDNVQVLKTCLTLWNWVDLLWKDLL